MRPLLRALLCLASLAALGGCTKPAASFRGQFEPSVAAAENGFAVAWHGEANHSSDVYYQWLNAEGEPRGSSYRLTSDPTDSFEPDIAVLHGQVAVAWYDKDESAKTSVAKLGVWEKDGKPAWIKQISSPGRIGRNPVVRADRERLLCAWLEYGEGEAPHVVAQWFDSKGTAQSAAIRVAPAGKTTWNLNAAIDDSGHAWIAFDATVQTRVDELFLAELADGEVRAVRLTADDGHASKYPDLRFAGGRMALTWFDQRDGNQEVYLFVGASAMPQPIEERAVRVTHTKGHSVGAYLAWNHGLVGLAWCDDTQGQFDIYFAKFDAAGVRSTENRRISDGKAHVWVPAIQPWRDGFASVWSESPGRPTHAARLAVRVIDE